MPGRTRRRLRCLLRHGEHPLPYYTRRWDGRQRNERDHMIYTIGYTGIPLAQLQAFLDAHQALLVDLRYRPSLAQPSL